MGIGSLPPLSMLEFLNGPHFLKACIGAQDTVSSSAQQIYQSSSVQQKYQTQEKVLHSTHFPHLHFYDSFYVVSLSRARVG